MIWLFELDLKLQIFYSFSVTVRCFFLALFKSNQNTTIENRIHKLS